MATGTGIFLVATTDAEGVLFRASTGLAYDCVAAVYAPSWPVGGTHQVYVLQCALGKPPTWAPTSPYTLAAWQDLQHHPCVRSVLWVPCTGTQRALVSRFVATCCLSMVPWTKWTPSALGGLTEAPGTYVHTSTALPSTWERMADVVGTTHGAPAALVEQVDGWVDAVRARVPPVVDLNRALASVGKPPMEGTGSASAVLLVLPLAAPRALYVPELTSAPLPLWFPELGHLAHTELEELNLVLHSPGYITDPLYDELRQTCQKNLEHSSKR